jgi:uncharacterized protein
MVRLVVDVTYDPAKNKRNIRERELSFDRSSEFDFETAFFFIDDRKDHREVGICSWARSSGAASPRPWLGLV